MSFTNVIFVMIVMSIPPSYGQLPILKDGNMFLSFHVDNKSIQQQFTSMIASDAEFLAQANIMDYSLLVGVTFHKNAADAVDIAPGSSQEDIERAFSATNAKCWHHRIHCWAGIEVGHVLTNKILLSLQSFYNGS